MNQTVWPWEQVYRKNRIVTVRTYRMIKKIMSDFRFFGVREALEKKIIRSFSTSQTLEENYIFFDVREALGKKVIRRY